MDFKDRIKYIDPHLPPKEGTTSWREYDTITVTTNADDVILALNLDKDKFIIRKGFKVFFDGFNPQES